MIIKIFFTQVIDEKELSLLCIQRYHHKGREKI